MGQYPNFKKYEPIPTTFAGSIKLDSFLRDYGTVLVTEDLTSTFDPLNAKDGSQAEINIKANGVNTVSLENFDNEHTVNFDNTLDTVNTIAFRRIKQSNFCRLLKQKVETTPAKLAAPTVTGSALNTSSVHFSW